MVRMRVTRASSPAGMLLLSLALSAGGAQAQDSFDSQPAPRRQTTQPALPATAPHAAPQRAAPIAPTQKPPAASSAAGGELQDFGVKPTTQLRATNQLHGPTPTTIPGGKVVSTQQLAEWMKGQQGQQGRVMLLHAIGSQQHLPNAIPATPASQGGSFDDQVQRDFSNYLQQATGGDKSRLMVTYCAGVQCWGSYNAALRAIRMGYTNVYWYRGGMEAWQAAGLSLLTAGSSQGPR